MNDLCNQAMKPDPRRNEGILMINVFLHFLNAPAEAY